MPRNIDTEERKRLIAKTVWGLVATSGLKSATVRNIAEASHLSVGSVQHVFKSTKDIYLFAMNQAVENAATRINAMSTYSNDPLAIVERTLLELLPLDETREAEARTWLAFTAEALVDQSLAETSAAMQTLLRHTARSCIESLIAAGLMRVDSDIELEASSLQAFVDGLTLQILATPATMSRPKANEALRAYLQKLCT